jgi:hypothetical protein
MSAMYPYLYSEYTHPIISSSGRKSPELPSHFAMCNFNFVKYFSECRFVGPIPSTVPSSYFELYNKDEEFYSFVERHLNKTLQLLVIMSSSQGSSSSSIKNTTSASLSLHKVSTTAALFFSSPTVQKALSSMPSSLSYGDHTHLVTPPVIPSTIRLFPSLKSHPPPVPPNIFKQPHPTFAPSVEPPIDCINSPIPPVSPSVSSFNSIRSSSLTSSFTISPHSSPSISSLSPSSSTSQILEKSEASDNSSLTSNASSHISLSPYLSPTEFSNDKNISDVDLLVSFVPASSSDTSHHSFRFFSPNKNASSLIPNSPPNETFSTLENKI